MEEDGFSATSSTADEIRAMKETGLLVRLVVIPTSSDQARVFVQLIPDTVDSLKRRLLDEDGNAVRARHHVPRRLFLQQ